MQGAPLRACLVVEARASGAVSVRLSETGTLRHQRARITRMATRHDIEEHLAAARATQTLVRLMRSLRNADSVAGFVVGIGERSVLLTQIADGGYFDGLVAVRMRDIVSVNPDSTFEGQFARTQPQWPPRAPNAIGLDTTSGPITSLAAISPLIGIEQEDHFTSTMQWIGTVTEVSDGWLWLREVRPDATWHEQPLGYKLDRITKIEVVDRYLSALAAVAGDPP